VAGNRLLGNPGVTAAHHAGPGLATPVSQLPITLGLAWQPWRHGCTSRPRGRQMLALVHAAEPLALPPQVYNSSLMAAAGGSGALCLHHRRRGDAQRLTQVDSYRRLCIASHRRS
jgi:hypothetical protein